MSTVFLITAETKPLETRMISGCEAGLHEITDTLAHLGYNHRVQEVSLMTAKQMCESRSSFENARVQVIMAAVAEFVRPE
jgi:hypothetical protein